MENINLKADLIAGFGGLKFIPMPFVFSTNNFNPKLILYENHIEYRGGFVSRKLTYKNIEKIDVYFMGKFTNSLVIYKTNSVWTFVGNFRKKQQLKEFLAFFEAKGCNLTAKAKAKLNAD